MSTQLKLITEYTESFTTKRISADGDKPGRLYLEGVFLHTGPNKNRRYYDMDTVLLPEVTRYINEKVENGTALGELGHPPTPVVEAKNACIKIESLQRQGADTILGRALVTNTPMGNIVEGLYNDGVRFGVSSRGLGSVKPRKDGINEVQKDFRLSTAADVVMDPSAPGAFVQGIMEGVEWIYENGEYIAVQSKIQIEKAARARALTEQAKLRIFDNFLKSLNQ